MSIKFYNTKIGNYFKTLKNRKRKNLLKMRGGGTGENIKKRVTFWSDSFQNSASTYSPTLAGSTIGVKGLNFSVRDGKRWVPFAIDTF